MQETTNSKKINIGIHKQQSNCCSNLMQLIAHTYKNFRTSIMVFLLVKVSKILRMGRVVQTRHWSCLLFDVETRNSTRKNIRRMQETSTTQS